MYHVRTKTVVQGVVPAQTCCISSVRHIIVVLLESISHALIGPFIVNDYDIISHWNPIDGCEVISITLCVWLTCTHINPFHCLYLFCCGFTLGGAEWFRFGLKTNWLREEDRIRIKLDYVLHSMDAADFQVLEKVIRKSCMSTGASALKIQSKFPWESIENAW